MEIVKSLHKSMEDLLDHSEEICAGHPPLVALRRLVEEKRRSLEKPMRVAFVGRTNAGKSTMLNAFLGEHLAAMGTVPLTFNVSWIKYGREPGLIAHMVDGTMVAHPMELLNSLSVRESDNGLLGKIRFLEFQRPNEILRKFDLIDTPGLRSFYENDSRNTKALLTDEETRPHAIVFLFSSTLKSDDLQDIEAFHKVSGNVMSGLTAIGGLTKVDTSEHYDQMGGMEEGWRCIKQIETHHTARRAFYSILPVAGHTAFGAQILDQNDLQTIADLAALPKERIWQQWKKPAELFATKDYPDLPPISARKRVIDKLGLFGIKRAIEALREGVPTDALPSHMVQLSGVEKLRDLVTAHFGNRAFLIKSRATLGAIHEMGFPLAHSLAGDAGRAARDVVNLVARILLKEPRFGEFCLLEKFYAGKLELSASEVEDLLLVTGEKGPSCAHRLGFEAEATVEQMVQTATKRQNYWRAVGSDPFGEMERRDCAAKLTDSYGHILNRIHAAVEHRKAAEELLAYEN